MYKIDEMRNQILLGNSLNELKKIPTESIDCIITSPPVMPMLQAGCPNDGIVLGPLSGAGTVAVVAKKLGRDFIGIELNPDYVAIGDMRLSKIFGKNLE